MSRFPSFRKLGTVLFMVALLLAATAHAGVEDVSKRLRASAVGKVMGDWTVRDTLVRGWYSLHHPSGQYEPYIIDENATLLRTNEGWQPLGSGLGPALDAGAEQRLRAAFFRSLRTEDAIAYRFGAGTKKAALSTAHDCPICKMLEREMTAAAGALDATVFVYPMSLDYRNAAAMETATKLWCCPDAVEAWHAVMQGGGSAKAQGQVPAAAGGCGFRKAEFTRTLARMVGAAGVPALLFEDGTLRRGAVSTAELRALLGKAGRTP